MTDREHQLDHELTAAVAARAPQTLVSRVMLAVAQAESTPWYARAWVTWPRGLQVCSAALLAALVVGLWWAIPSAQSWIPDVASPLWDRAVVRLAPAAHAVSQVATLVRVLWDVIIQPIALYFLILVVALALVCAVLWTAVTGVALGGASTS